MPRSEYYRKNREHLRQYQKEWVKRHREQKRKWGRARAARLRLRLQRCKAVPCTDCGNRYPTYVMEFDHIKPPKSYRGRRICMSTAAGMSSTIFESELAKCEVVCANCHKIRTHARRVGIWKQGGGD